VLFGNTYSWFTSESSVKLVSAESGMLKGAVQVGNAGFELKSSLVQAPRPNLYPGDAGEAVYEIKNTGKSAVMFRIGGFSESNTFLSKTNTYDFGFTASFNKKGSYEDLYKIDSAQYKAEYQYSGIDEYRYGILQANETMLIKLDFIVADNGTLPGTTEKLDIAIDSCEANIYAVNNYYGLTLIDTQFQNIVTTFK
jgi:hypothetical protein